MDILELSAQLHTKNDAKIVLLVADGLGGLPQTPAGQTELEAALTPNLDELAKNNISGLSIPVLPGITPGSGPGHLALFGYDPLKVEIGRGVLEALGIDFDLKETDIAARSNFCTIDGNGVITDRRAGRISTEKCAQLVEKLRSIKIDGIEIIVEHAKEYRFVTILRGSDLGGEITDTDPQITGVVPLEPVAKDEKSQKTVDIIKQFIQKAKEVLKEEHPANMILFRGFGKHPAIPSVEKQYGLHAAAIATYPMYRGVARLAGMTILPVVKTFQEQIALLKEQWNNYDFFFVHYKYTDGRGEDGDFAAKVKCIEELDTLIPEIMNLHPEVLLVTGDHSTPATMKAHSWHPVPTLLVSKNCRPDKATAFGESACLQGGLGQIEAKYLLPLAMAHALKLKKFGA